MVALCTLGIRKATELDLEEVSLIVAGQLSSIRRNRL